ncbi:MAG: phosphoglycerate kinase, partial [Bacilli bacterium]|nr:phosphoglycerate kinase [Bacilli bacterium]
MKKSIKDFELKNKKVIIRCDFNVPMRDGKITDDNRIVESIPTIKYALDNGAKIILMSHLGKVKTEEDMKKNSLKPVAKRLEELLNTKVTFIDETRGSKLEDAVNSMSPYDIILMENTRFEDLEGKKESSNDLELGKYWANLGDIFINDAFGTAHRCHASNVGIASNIDSGVGFLIQKELEILEPAIIKPKNPFVVILGGAKVSDKIKVIEHLTEIADYILIGGGMCHTFLKAEGYNVGNSLVDNDSLDFCSDVLKKYSNKIILPIDLVVNDEFKDIKGKVKDINEIDDEEMSMDIGPKTIELFGKYIKDAKQIIWNGPMGVFEF